MRLEYFTKKSQVKFSFEDKLQNTHSILSLLEPNKKTPVIIYKSLIKEKIYKLHHDSKKLIPEGMLSALLHENNIEKDEAIVVITTKKELPNKETKVKTFLIVKWNLLKNKITFDYNYSLSKTQQEIIETIHKRIIKKKCCLKGSIKERDISMRFLWPNSFLRADIFLTIIMCDKDIREIAQVSEKTSIAKNKDCRISISSNTEFKQIPIRVREIQLSSITLSKRLDIKLDTYCVYFSINRAEKHYYREEIETIIKKICDTYLKQSKFYKDIFEEILETDFENEKYNKKESRLRTYRGEVPELFVQRYSRESPIMPIIIDKKTAIDLIAQGKSVIKYPEDGPYSRYYTAPKGYFVGLKTNRLHNNDKFEYIVTCYEKNHSNKQGTNTYNYIHGIKKKQTDKKEYYLSKVKKLEPYQKGLLSENISKILHYSERETLVRIGLPYKTEDFLRNMLRMKDEKPIPQLAKQELWYLTIEEINNMWKNKTNYQNLILMKRIIEEMIEAEIIVVEDSEKSLKIEKIQYKEPYLWINKYNKMLILVKNNGNYEMIGKRNGDIFFYPDDTLYKVFIDAKEKTVSEVQKDGLITSYILENIEKDIKLQYIDDFGKVVIVETVDGRLLETMARPIKTDYKMIEDCDSIIKRYEKESMSIKGKIEKVEERNNYITLIGDRSFLFWKESNNEMYSITPTTLRDINKGGARVGCLDGIEIEKRKILLNIIRFITENTSSEEENVELKHHGKIKETILGSIREIFSNIKISNSREPFLEDHTKLLWINNETEEEVKNSIKLIRTLEPKKALVNIPLQLFKNTFVEFYDGEIWLQPWDSNEKKELLIVTSNKEIKRNYDTKYYEEKLNFYDTEIRGKICYENPAFDIERGFDLCSDCCLETYIMTRFLDKFKEARIKNPWLDQLNMLSNTTCLKTEKHGNLYEF